MASSDDICFSLYGSLEPLATMETFKKDTNKQLRIPVTFLQRTPQHNTRDKPGSLSDRWALQWLYLEYRQRMTNKATKYRQGMTNKATKGRI